jgi:hypothetical protein
MRSRLRLLADMISNSSAARQPTLEGRVDSARIALAPSQDRFDRQTARIAL